VVEIEAVPEKRLPEAVELTAYLVVSESLAGEEDHVVALRLDGQTLEVEISGVAVAEEPLQRLRDRVESLDGRIEGGSGEGAGTLRARIPIAVG
jgi:hypothetical protein